MGIRSVETRLAPELCFEAVEATVEQYLSESQKEGRLLPPNSYLIFPMLRTGFHPPGLYNVVDLIGRHQESARAQAKGPGNEQDNELLPSADYLIEGIMSPYPFSRLRAYRHRARRKRRARQMAENLERKGVQRNATRTRHDATDYQKTTTAEALDSLTTPEARTE